MRKIIQNFTLLRHSYSNPSRVTGQINLETGADLKHTGYHTNHSIWTQQIAGFGCERPSQIPLVIPKRPPNTINMHRPPNARLSLNTNGLALSIQGTRRRQEVWTCIIFSAYLRKGWASEKQSAWPRPFTDATQSIHSSISGKNGRMGAGRRKKENPQQFIIHGEGIFLSGLLYRSLSQHITLSISPDKCQSKGLSPGFFFFLVGGRIGGFQRQ